MPTYPYACTECGHQFETRQSFSDDPLTACPECSGRLRKVWGSVGVVFKGSGFYRTDSRSSGSTSSSDSSASGGSDGSSGSGSSGSDGSSGSSDSKSSSESKGSDSSSSSSSSKTGATAGSGS